MTVVVVILLCFEEKECNAHRESLSLHTCLRDFTLVHRIQFLICAWTHLREITTRIRLLLLWSTQHSMVWFPLCVFTLMRVSLLMQHERHWARIDSFTFVWGIYTLSRLCEVYFAKHVIQASTASSHRVGKCIFEPSKQSRIRKSSFWSHRRSTVQWETALSSKERSRRVNCPMLVPYILHRVILLRISKFTKSTHTLTHTFFCHA